MLKDIKSERPKITEKDNVRLLYITKWFLEFFLMMQAQEKGKSTETDATWDFGLVSEVLERSWIIWILKRMREAVEAKVSLKPIMMNNEVPNRRSPNSGPSYRQDSNA